ncbi:MAG: DUF411 domain-containing protein [Halioglobus sp.]
MLRYSAYWMLVVLCTVSVVASSGEDSSGRLSAGTVIDVYKSPTCGCCGDWIEHIQGNGFKTEIHHPNDLNQLKADKGIAAHFQSCHTAVTADGYVFEGHVPAIYIQRFLDEKPKGAVGLAVPGMPVGSPGMEVGDKFMPYQVLLLKRDGSAEVYADILSPADQ